MFNAMSVVKFAVSGVVGIGTGKIVKGIIASNVPTPGTPIDKVTITAASWVLSAIVTKASKNTTNEMIDDVYKGVSGIVSGIKESQKLGRINKGESTFADEGLDQTQYHLKDDQKWYPNKISTDETPAAS